jgi:peptidoglycan/xylan/chitin deacetylase (PgdA/CDA1 family)
MLNSKKLVSLAGQAFPDAVFFKEVENQAKVLALTIDDVPARDDDSDISTRHIIEVIEQHNQEIGANVKVTFFVTTNHLTNDSSIVEEMARKGHEIVNHGTTDHRHADLSPQNFEDEFLTAHHKLNQKINQPIRWFRPGQAFYNENMLQTLRTKGQQLGYQDKFALASMIPFDTCYFLDDPKFTLKNISRFTFPGSILVLHGGVKEQASNTVEVLKQLLPNLHQQGYELVTLSELFS